MPLKITADTESEIMKQLASATTIDAKKAIAKSYEGAEVVNDKWEVIKTLSFTIETPAPVETVTPVASASPAGMTDAQVKALGESIVKGALEGMGNDIDRKIKAHITTRDLASEDPTGGFKNFGEQVRSIKMACENRVIDKRLDLMKKAAPAAYSAEGTGVDGGYLVAPEFAKQILMYDLGAGALFDRVSKIPVMGNSYAVPRDETTPWGTDGIRCFWTGEAAQATATKPKIGQDQIVLQKLTALVPVTEEMTEDSFIGLGEYFTSRASTKIRYALDDAILNGTGAGQPLGWRNSGAVLSVAADAAQTTNTYTLGNAARQIAAIPGDGLSRCVWIAHPTVTPQVITMVNGNQSLFVAPGDITTVSGSFGRFFGLPYVPFAGAQTLGAPGDISLCDMRQYLMVTKSTGIDVAMSIHLYFDYSINTMRFNFRAAGQPWPKAPITLPDNVTKQSYFVQVAQR